MDAKALIDRLGEYGIKQRDIARALDLAPDKISKSYAGIRQLKASEYAHLSDWLAKIEASGGYVEGPDLPGNDPRKTYLPVEVLPSFAGMGGGGTGEGDEATALISRELIEDVLRAKAADMLLIDVRGDSMEPDFQHGDQILIDKRDADPRQPGPFALWDGDGYVVKLVERVPQERGRYRIFSANGRYADYTVSADDVRIMGRPVWFARRL